MVGLIMILMRLRSSRQVRVYDCSMVAVFHAQGRRTANRKRYWTNVISTGVG